MRKLLLALLLLGGDLGTALAQNPITDEPLASQQLKQRLRAQYLPSDTAQAIITLYSRRQAGGVSWMTGAALAALRFALVSGSSTSLNTSPYYQPTQPSAGADVGVALLVATPIAGYGLGKLLRYSNTHLQQVLAAYAAGQPLPHALRRKLKPRFFAAPIIPYRDVTAQPVR